MSDSGLPPETADDPPPILGTWKRVYTFVLCFLALVIVLFYAFTRFFS